jgi:hypothetical protein
MNIKLSRLVPVFCLGFFPASLSGQCKDQSDRHCWNLQYILYAAQTDFREFRGVKPANGGHAVKPPNPDVSVGAANVPCHMSNWSSAVSVYMCSADIRVADLEEWYAKTMADLHQLQYLWQFKIETAGTDHYVDAGPTGCEVAPVDKTYSDGTDADGPYLAEGPYRGQCPLHLQAVQQADGAAKVYFWLSSYTSPYLARKPDSPSRSFPPSAKSQSPQSASTSQSTSPSSATTEGSSSEASGEHSSAHAASKYASCDDLRQGLKEILEDRTTAFRELDAASTVADNSGAGSSDRTVKLSGASSCSIHRGPSAGTRSAAQNAPFPRVHLAPVSFKDSTAASAPAASLPPAQYVCYWPEDSASAAENQFRDLVAVLQMLIPSNWSAHQQNQADELSGAEVTVWAARDSRNKAAVGIYLNGKSVGLHVSASD